MSFLPTLAIIIGLLLFARWFGGWGIGAPYLPVRRRDIEDGLALARIQPGETVVDLGSGDGRLLLAAARKGAKVVGYELNPLMVWLARWRLRHEHASVIRADLRKADLSQADVVFCFGITNLMPEILAMAKRPRSKPLRLVTFAFPLPQTVADEERGIAFLYYFP